jgi:ribosomal protein L37AE/L43A
MVADRAGNGRKAAAAGRIWGRLQEAMACFSFAKERNSTMRLLFSALLVFGLLAGASIARPAAAVTKKPAAHAQKVKASYVCPKCGMKSAKAGKCPHCKVALVRSTPSTAMYECTMCHVTSAKAGKCPKCGMTMTKVASKPGKM